MTGAVPTTAGILRLGDDDEGTDMHREVDGTAYMDVNLL